MESTHKCAFSCATLRSIGRLKQSGDSGDSSHRHRPGGSSVSNSFSSFSGSKTLSSRSSSQAAQGRTSWGQEGFWRSFEGLWWCSLYRGQSGQNSFVLCSQSRSGGHAPRYVGTRLRSQSHCHWRSETARWSWVLDGKERHWDAERGPQRMPELAGGLRRAPGKLREDERLLGDVWSFVEHLL